MTSFPRTAASLLAVALLGAPMTGAPAEPERFALDDVLSAPFVDQLTASPKLDALTWTVHERGARNVAVWTPAGGAREVTHETADDGQELDAPQLTPGDTAVVYARGGAGQDGGGDNPNPTSPVKPLPRRILLTSLASGATIELGNGREPALSPTGDRVAWIGPDGQPAMAAISSPDGGATWKAAAAERPFAVRGTADSPLWSPDGKRLAIVTQRGTHAYVAIYALGAKNLVYAAPGFGNDGNPAWSADSARIAFVRQPGSPPDLTPYDEPSRVAPWSIVVADAATGAGGEVWRAPLGRGSEFSVADGVQPLWWSKDGDLAFVWERDGWRHLYALAGARGPAKLLTPGSYEVEQISAGANGTDLLYTSNEGDLDARHVWRVSFAGGAPERVTGGPANQWSPVDLSGARTAYLNATYNAAGAVTLGAAVAPKSDPVALAETLPAAPVPAAFPAALLVRPKPVVFTAPDGLKVHGQLFVPRGPGPHPALIFVHGGPERQMLLTFHYFEAYTNLYELNQFFVNRGFAVLSVNYRSGIMFGHDFYEAPKRGWLGASEYQDVLAGARFLGAQRGVDKKRLGIYGLSYGGYLTALALARNSDVFKAGADQAGVHDWRGFFDAFAGHPVGTARQRAIAYASSPMGSLATWRSPLYLDQGDDDRNVPFAQGVELAAELGARNVELVTASYPDELHEYATYAHELARFTASSDFLIAHLGAP
jgi:dipeptidyl aminopeptidase/acylaminoacyl peptidase